MIPQSLWFSKATQGDAETATSTERRRRSGLRENDPNRTSAAFLSFTVIFLHLSNVMSVTRHGNASRTS